MKAEKREGRHELYFRKFDNGRSVLSLDVWGPGMELVYTAKPGRTEAEVRAEAAALHGFGRLNVHLPWGPYVFAVVVGLTSRVNQETASARVEPYSGEEHHFSAVLPTWS